MRPSIETSLGVNSESPGDARTQFHARIIDASAIVRGIGRSGWARETGKPSLLMLPLCVTALLLCACGSVVVDEDPFGGSSSATTSSATASSGGSCPKGSFGDLTKPIEVIPLAFGPNDTVTELNDGDPVPILREQDEFPGIRIAAKATNISACAGLLAVDLSDPKTGENLHVSTAPYLQAVDGGWGGPGGSRHDFVAVPLCPSNWTSTVTLGNSFDLTVSISSIGGPLGSRSIHVLPYCGEPQNADYCICVCKQTGPDYEPCH